MITIQPSRVEDYAAIAECVDRVARERQFLAAIRGFPAESTRLFLENLLRNGGVHLSALDGTHLVGWIDLTPGPFEGLDHCARLGMGLLPAYRGRGLGRRLLTAAVDAGRKRGFERIELEVFASNTAAIRLYESAGFTAEGRKRHARKLDGRYDDIVLYALLLHDAR
jgi:ribosomal protein S18 acetylase RimI-like enzyme